MIFKKLDAFLKEKRIIQISTEIFLSILSIRRNTNQAFANNSTVYHVFDELLPVMKKNALKNH